MKIQKGYRDLLGFPNYSLKGREFTGKFPWIHGKHDSDLDGVPNYLDEDPLNPKNKNIKRR